MNSIMTSRDTSEIPEIPANISIKCVAVGDKAVGRTSLLVSYTGQSPYGYDPNRFFSRSVLVNGLNVNMDIFDNDVDHRMRPLFYRATDVFLLTFSLIDRHSFENIRRKWMPEIKRIEPLVPIVLVGTKQDLRNSKQYLLDHPEACTISKKEGKKLKKEIGAVAYIECSSETNKNVSAVFDAAINLVLPPAKLASRCNIM